MLKLLLCSGDVYGPLVLVVLLLLQQVSSHRGCGVERDGFGCVNRCCVWVLDSVDVWIVLEMMMMVVAVVV